MGRQSTSNILMILLICTQTLFGYALAMSNHAEQRSFLVNQLKELVLPKISPTSVINQFKNDDLYWNHWLNANSFNVTKASRHFLNNLKWREEQKIDTIHLEDWSYFKSEYPTFQASFDRTGRPIIEIWFSDWNIRQAVMSGRGKQVTRWLIYNYEIGMQRLFQTRADGFRNVTGAVLLSDYSGINIRTQGCARCVWMYETFLNVGKLHYPGIPEEWYMLNVPHGYKIIVSLWRQSLPEEQKNVYKVYGREHEWRKTLQSIIDNDQLSVRFGGTRDPQV